MTTTTNSVWDSVSDCVLSELDGTNAVQAVYTNEPQRYGSVISQRRGTTTSTLHADALGTTRALTSSTQTTTDSYLFDAWGNPISSSGSTGNPFRWVGRYGYYQDASTGLIYVRARMYQPTVARWCSKDPIGFEGSKRNLFEYGESGPLSGIDPEGTIYGNWCGPLLHGQDGGPIDKLDIACQAHDKCLATIREFLIPCNVLRCDAILCLKVSNPLICLRSSTPIECNLAAVLIRIYACNPFFGTTPGTPPTI